MKRIIPFLLVFLTLGCKNFETHKVSADHIVQKEMSEINWENLDTYPGFEACKHYSNKSQQKHCFEREISKHIYKVLGHHQVVLKDSVHARIVLHIVISNRGKPQLTKIQIPAVIKERIPKIKIWLHDAISSLPKIYPAEKRGVPVAAKFKLPLIIQSD